MVHFLLNATESLLKTDRFVDRSVKFSIHKSMNSSTGVIRCRDLAWQSYFEIKDELKSQGVVEVRRVMVKTNGAPSLTNTFFITFTMMTLPKDISSLLVT